MRLIKWGRGGAITLLAAIVLTAVSCKPSKKENASTAKEEQKWSVKMADACMARFR